MSVAADALTTLANLKEAVGVASSDTSKDAYLERLINRATADIERMTNRKMKARNYNGVGTAFATTAVTSEDYIVFSGSTQDKGGDTLYESGYGVFYLPQFPIQSVTPSIAFAVHVLEDREEGDWGTSLVENRDYVIDRTNGILANLNGRFASGFRNYRITGTAGYLDNGAQPYVPYDLEELCIAMVKKLYRNEQGLQSESLGTWSRSYNTEQAEKQIKESLSMFTRQRL
jgi:gp6-like head-tail connector protein